MTEGNARMWTIEELDKLTINRGNHPKPNGKVDQANVCRVTCSCDKGVEVSP